MKKIRFTMTVQGHKGVVSIREYTLLSYVHVSTPNGKALSSCSNSRSILLAAELINSIYSMPRHIRG